MYLHYDRFMSDIWHKLLYAVMADYIMSCVILIKV